MQFYKTENDLFSKKKQYTYLWFWDFCAEENSESESYLEELSSDDDADGQSMYLTPTNMMY